MALQRNAKAANSNPADASGGLARPFLRPWNGHALVASGGSRWNPLLIALFSPMKWVSEALNTRHSLTRFMGERERNRKAPHQTLARLATIDGPFHGPDGVERVQQRTNLGLQKAEELPRINQDSTLPISAVGRHPPSTADTPPRECDVNLSIGRLAMPPVASPSATTLPVPLTTPGRRKERTQ